MRVVIDRDLCQGHGVCESEAPEVFSLPKHATTVTVLIEEPDEALRPGIELAVEYCPTRAIAIVEG